MELKALMKDLKNKGFDKENALTVGKTIFSNMSANAIMEEVSNVYDEKAAEEETVDMPEEGDVAITEAVLDKKYGTYYLHKILPAAILEDFATGSDLDIINLDGVEGEEGFEGGEGENLEGGEGVEPEAEFNQTEVTPEVTTDVTTEVTPEVTPISTPTEVEPVIGNEYSSILESVDKLFTLRKKFK